ncbi:digestive organ expansion factor [Gloeopeniophorella convolvens]|nr:digestive organ expansion factor [Gloeopeniophorella convolvens]
MDSSDWTSPTTKLLTLLNVSAAKSLKRKHLAEQPSPSRKLNKRRALDELPTNGAAGAGEEDGEEEGGDGDVEMDKAESVAEEEASETEDPWVEVTHEQHFGAKPTPLTQAAIEDVTSKSWSTTNSSLPKLGAVAISKPSGSTSSEKMKAGSSQILQRLRTPFEKLQASLPPDLRLLQNDILSVLASHRDLYHTHTSLDTAPAVRESIALHMLDHVTKKRRRVLKNNERLAHAAKAGTPAPEDVQDQGFTRPSVLVLLPFRSSAFKWLDALTAHTPAPAFQLENAARFRREFGLPEGAEDKYAGADADAYPRDHVETFRGNPDDNFRVGLKLTRKSVRLFTGFYASDIILASPLGLRTTFEKEKTLDFLSSIEVLVVDQVEALTMQNWEHTQFVFSHLNQLPKESHDTDFSRIKPWYLDGQAAYLRQTVMLSAYETPETRSLYNQALKNVAGKVRTARRWAPVQVPEGLEQNFIRFECANPKDELDKRFAHFTAHVLPPVLKSAVQSANTVVFNDFRRRQLSFAVLSEYSSNADIARARQAFFTGKKAFLLVSERFHFYRRYKIRGIRNVIFYGPPDHAAFYTELLSFPFLDEGVEPADVTCRVLYSRYDWFRMERIAGTKGAAELVRGGGGL